MNFCVSKAVLAAVVIAVATMYAPVYSPGVAQRIMKNALIEVKRTGTIKNLSQLKQA